MTKLCECGCGQPAPVSTVNNASLGWVKGQPKRFVRGHARTGKRVVDRSPADFVGRRFGRWVILRDAGATNRVHYWTCQCDCGMVRNVQERHLLASKTQSCGCLARELAADKKRTHGLSYHHMKPMYYAMIARCHNPNSAEYSNYGERGIAVCDRWRDGFVNFLADMGERPDGMTLDRIDNDGPYSPENCRWATVSEQCNNTRANHLLTLGDKTQTITQWARDLDLHPNTIRSRLRYGWPVERVLDPHVDTRCRHKSTGDSSR